MKNPTETPFLTEAQVMKCAILSDPYKICTEVIMPNLDQIYQVLEKEWEPLALAQIAYYKINGSINSKFKH